MTVGSTLKGRYDQDMNAVGLWNIEATPGGTKIGAVKEGEVLGTYVRTETKWFTDYHYVKLATPINSGGKLYQYAYIQAAKVYESNPTMAKYYATNTYVNVRSTPSASVATNKLYVLSPNEYAGEGDGTKQNGFLLLKLAKTGKSGWVSANYLTTRVPNTTGTPTGTTTGTTTGGDGTAVQQQPPKDPADQNQKEKLETGVQNYVGESGTSILKWLCLGLGALLLGVVLMRLLFPRKPATSAKPKA